MTKIYRYYMALRMRSKNIERAFREAITSAMANKLPRFTRLDSNKAYGPTLNFRYSLRKNCHCFASFQFSDRTSDAFTVEFGWDVRASWNYDIPLEIPVDIPESKIIRSNPINGRFRFRIAFLRPPHRDVWWILTPEPTLEEIMNWLDAMEPPVIEPLSANHVARMNELIDDAIALIKNKAIPFFEEFEVGPR